MYSVTEVKILISAAIRQGKGVLKLPSGKRVRLTKTLKTFYYRGVICAHCGLAGTTFREVSHNDKVHLQLFGSKESAEVLMTCDHIIPHSKGGTNNFYNLQTLCCQCNYDKKDNIDQKVIDEALYSYKSINDHIFNTYPRTRLRNKFAREFRHIQNQAAKTGFNDSGLLCGKIDEILQLLYYIQNKYGYEVRLTNLRRMPSQNYSKTKRLS
jgi:hypothetical protein